MSGTGSRRLVAVGDNCLDVYLTYDRLAVGGNALNVAAQWHRAGWAARYFGAVGDDPEAGIVLDAVAAAGLSAGDVDQLIGDTGVTLLSHESGDRTFLHEALGVGDGYVPSAAGYAAIRGAHWVHLGTNANADLVRRLVSDGVPFSVDISTRHTALPLDGVPLVFASGTGECETSVPRLLAELRGRGARRVVVTHGRDGAFFDDGVRLVHAPATPVEVLDTCGAGDSFIATFLIAFCCERREVGEAMRRATDAAALTCTHLGGFPQEPRHVPEWLLTKYAYVLEAGGRTS